MNGVWIITFFSHLHVWITKFKPLFMFFQLLVLTLNNIIWVDFSTILFDETQHVVKTSIAGYVPISYEIVNLFIEPQNFLLMFFICKLKGFYLIVTVCDALLMISFDLFNSCIKPTWYNIFQDVLLKCLTLVVLRFYNDMTPKTERNSCLVLMILRPRPVPHAHGEVVFMSFLMGISHLSRPPLMYKYACGLKHFLHGPI